MSEDADRVRLLGTGMVMIVDTSVMLVEAESSVCSMNITYMQLHNYREEAPIFMGKIW